MLQLFTNTNIVISKGYLIFIISMSKKQYEDLKFQHEYLAGAQLVYW